MIQGTVNLIDLRTRPKVIVCLCKGVSDRKIREMAQQGQSLRQIITNCEASTCCGACASDIKELVKIEAPSQSNLSRQPGR